MMRMTKEDARNRVVSLAPGASREAIEWGAEMMLIVSRACGGHTDYDRSWVKALEVSTKPYAGVLLDAVNSVPPRPELLPAGWEAAAQAV